MVFPAPLSSPLSRLVVVSHNPAGYLPMAFCDAMVFRRIPVTEFFPGSGFRTGTKEKDMNMKGGHT
jgi:hypothetical protein